ncbi:MAG: Ni/Fe hydrogenase subunit beta [Omnitrophica WOR_2 bacterium RIFCSPLOWO2_12_FULL_51_24]|nr:MAG: Ni/Fe hydrogenase subunit beta [Omnitrophica WOR_2 bacterium RIFCSPLOWO2_02_FULL_50_19]OGX41866.1 MAG: Ni/Fe hydrogenase subunit beta [Omnitrophica WOR_2 bacterium RIFCSPLOWO2_12_FULL_51_24]
MRYLLLKKENFNDFISALAQIEKVVAPVAAGYKNFSFREVKSGKEISVKYIPTILPPKKYFMPQKEKLIEFNKAESLFDAVLEYEKMIIFGVHTCDLAGIQCLDMVFSDKPKDANYLGRKNKLIIIGLECNDYCDEYASCKVVDNHIPNGGYDLFFTELNDSFIVHVNTGLGEEIVEKTRLLVPAEQKHLNELEDVRARKREIFKDEVNVKHAELAGLFDKAFDSKVWDDLDKRCVACGNCTNVCPTCYCFDILDNINLDFNTGDRTRGWDSCQTEPFAKVAGGENFRKTRGARQRHRYFRKFKYPVERYSRYFCTGCGRCTRTCMAKISLKETINALAAEQKK